MGKKAKEYKAGDFIFAKVKGYPAWPARVQKQNGKKYFVYFYGTGETANLAPNMIFDYADNKDKFLTKTVKRKDFNDGVKQIEYDFTNNIPLEEVIGAPVEEPMDTSAADETANDSSINDSALDESAADTTADDTAAADESNATQSEAAVEDSDDGALVIDEGKKGKKPAAKPPATPKTVKELKTSRGKAKKEEPKETKETEDDKKDEEIVSRSGRKIRPKRYIDEQTEENTTLPSPAPKKRRGASPTAAAVDKEKPKADASSGEKPADKHYNALTQSELEDLKEPFSSEEADKENILIAYLPNGQYVGVKLFQSKPISFKNKTAELQWYRQAASNAVTLKRQLEKGHITSQSVCAQLETELNLTDEEKANLDKEREIEEKKSRVQFLKTEMKLIELDAKIKSCLSLEKADTELCLKLIDELTELDIKSLMLLKHPTCLETVKRMRAYVGNTPSWELSDSDAITFSKQAHRIRKRADNAYKLMKDLFLTPEGLSFWEYFSERVLLFKRATAKFSADELLEMVHEPIELSQPFSHDMKEAIDGANENPAEPAEEPEKKKKATPAKPKKAKAEPPTPTKTPAKRQSSRTKPDKSDPEAKKKPEVVTEKEAPEKIAEEKTAEETAEEPAKEAETLEKEKEVTESKEKPVTENKEKPDAENKKKPGAENKEKPDDENEKSPPKDDKEAENPDVPKEVEKEVPVEAEVGKSAEKVEEQNGKEDSVEESGEKEQEKVADKTEDEPKSKRSRESKKTEVSTPKTPTKRKTRT